VEDRHKKEGVVLLAVSIDGEDTRPKIPELLKKNGLHCRVLLTDPGRLEGYRSDTASILYIVNRGGWLAGVPGEFGRNLAQEAEKRIAVLRSTQETPGPLLYRIEKAPAGFGVLWKRPLKEQLKGVAMAPASPGHPAEIGVLEGTRLRRYSSSGQPLGEAEIEVPEPTFLKSADLDADGRNEWIIGEERTFTVMDSQGQVFWRYLTTANSIGVGGFMDLDGDGMLETVVQDGSSVVARKALSGNLWKTSPLGELRSIVRDPRGAFLVQSEKGIQTLDRLGRLGAAVKPLPKLAVLKGRISGGDRGDRDLIGYEGNMAVLVHNLVGDGKEEILVVGGGVLEVYSREGEPRALLTSPNRWPRQMAVGDLDGRPGDELVLAIPDYGLVALGVGKRGPSPRTGR
jgi:hypothetical protein